MVGGSSPSWRTNLLKILNLFMTYILKIENYSLGVLIQTHSSSSSTNTLKISVKKAQKIKLFIENIVVNIFSKQSHPYYSLTKTVSKIC